MSLKIGTFSTSLSKENGKLKSKRGGEVTSLASKDALSSIYEMLNRESERMEKGKGEGKIEGEEREGRRGEMGELGGEDEFGESDRLHDSSIKLLTEGNIQSFIDFFYLSPDFCLDNLSELKFLMSALPSAENERIKNNSQGTYNNYIGVASYYESIKKPRVAKYYYAKALELMSGTSDHQQKAYVLYQYAKILSVSPVSPTSPMSPLSSPSSLSSDSALEQRLASKRILFRAYTLASKPQEEEKSDSSHRPFSSSTLVVMILEKLLETCKDIIYSCIGDVIEENNYLTSETANNGDYSLNIYKNASPSILDEIEKDVHQLLSIVKNFQHQNFHLETLILVIKILFYRKKFPQAVEHCLEATGILSLASSSSLSGGSSAPLSPSFSNQTAAQQNLNNILTYQVYYMLSLSYFYSGNMANAIKALLSLINHFHHGLSPVSSAVVPSSGSSSPPPFAINNTRAYLSLGLLYSKNGDIENAYAMLQNHFQNISSCSTSALGGNGGKEEASILLGIILGILRNKELQKKVFA